MTTVAGQKIALQACHTAALKKAPTLQGQFTYSISVAATGKVTKVVARGATKQSAELDACMIKRLSALSFGPGTEQTINYPFIFRATDDPPPVAKEPTKEAPVDPLLVKMFDDASDKGRTGKHADALAAYHAIQATERKKKLVVPPGFTATLLLHISYEEIDLKKLDDAQKTLESIDVSALGKATQYDYYFTLGNVHGGRGNLGPMSADMSKAIAISEELGDKTSRPATCWSQMIKFSLRAKDWVFVKDVSAKALEVAKELKLEDLEKEAFVAQSEAETELKK